MSIWRSFLDICTLQYVLATIAAAAVTGRSAMHCGMRPPKNTSGKLQVSLEAAVYPVGQVTAVFLPVG